MLGCIGNIYNSIQNLNETYMPPNQSKNVLIQPAAPSTPLLLHDTNQRSQQQTRLYVCSRCYRSVADNRDTTCIECVLPINEVVPFIRKKRDLVTYIVTYDFSVSTMPMIPVVALLNEFNVKDISALEEKVVELGMNEKGKLFKASLNSEAALTNVFPVKEEVKASVKPNGDWPDWVDAGSSF